MLDIEHDTRWAHFRTPSMADCEEWNRIRILLAEIGSTSPFSKLWLHAVILFQVEDSSSQEPRCMPPGEYGTISPSVEGIVLVVITNNNPRFEPVSTRKRGGVSLETFSIGQGDDRMEFEGEKLDEKILGTGPEDTRRITYYKTSDGRYLKHEVFGIDDDADEREHRIEEVSSFEIP